MQRGGKVVCVCFKHELALLERMVNNEVDISDIELQTDIGSHCPSFPPRREAALGLMAESPSSSPLSPISPLFPLISPRPLPNSHPPSHLLKGIRKRLGEIWMEKWGDLGEEIREDGVSISSAFSSTLHHLPPCSSNLPHLSQSSQISPQSLQLPQLCVCVYIHICTYVYTW